MTADGSASFPARGSAPPEPLYLEVTPLLVKPLAGIGRSVARLVPALAQLTPLRLFTTVHANDSRHMNLSSALVAGEELAVTAQDLPPDADLDLDLWVRRLLRRPRRQHDFRLAERSAAVYTLFRPPQRHFRREVCLLHDFTTLLLPWAHPTQAREHFGPLFSEYSGVCDKAVAVSQATRADATWLSALPPEDVVVSYQGPSLCVRSHAQPRSIAQTDDLILVVSTLEPRKNGRFLLDWFLETEVLPPHARLWWVGPTGWLYDRRQWAIPPKSRGRQVRFLGMVSDRRLCDLYQQASFTVYPSLYEGFGFPVLDALLHGRPALSSFNSSLQEFAGPGVFYFDPCDRTSLDTACRELLSCSPLEVDRADLRARCSWDALAGTLVSLCS
jgi:glycosyltransferase involved in cell wall biosynthesis